MNTNGHDPYNTAPVRTMPAPERVAAYSRDAHREATEILKCYETVLALADAARSVL